jgi:hypothetical protein
MRTFLTYRPVCMLFKLKINHNCDPPGSWLLTFSAFVVSCPDCMKSWSYGACFGVSDSGLVQGPGPAARPRFRH